MTSGYLLQIKEVIIIPSEKHSEQYLYENENIIKSGRDTQSPAQVKNKTKRNKTYEKGQTGTNPKQNCEKISGTTKTLATTIWNYKNINNCIIFKIIQKSNEYRYARATLD